MYRYNISQLQRNMARLMHRISERNIWMNTHKMFYFVLLELVITRNYSNWFIFIVCEKSINEEFRNVTREKIYKYLFPIDHNTTENFHIFQIFGKQATAVFHNMGE